MNNLLVMLNRFEEKLPGEIEIRITQTAIGYEVEAIQKVFKGYAKRPKILRFTREVSFKELENDLAAWNDFYLYAMEFYREHGE